jgi:hypothetical protein
VEELERVEDAVSHGMLCEDLAEEAEAGEVELWKRQELATQEQDLVGEKEEKAEKEEEKVEEREEKKGLV